MRKFYSSTALGCLFLLFNAIGVLQFWYKHLDHVTRGYPVAWLEPFLEQLTGNWVSFAMLIFFTTPIVLRFRIDLDRSAPKLLAHFSAIPVYSMLHTSGMWIFRLVLFPLLGLGSYDYGKMPVRYLMEFPNDIIDYSITVAALIFFLRTREARIREVRMAELEGDLARARLEALSLQLQPHFLFNSLNTVAALIHEDPQRADLMLSRLAGYLRRTLQSGPEQRVPLDQELETLELYLTMMKARFEDNLTMHLQIDEQTRRALAPQLILQPIIENAIQHGYDPASSRVRVELSASRADQELVLNVRDHGRGVDPASAPRIGLANTRNRLKHLYGTRASLTITNAAGGGAEVEIRIPFELAS